MKTLKNHELWHNCPNCNHEYNFWDHGHTCPMCALKNRAPIALAIILFLICITATLSAQPTMKYKATVKTLNKTEVINTTEPAAIDSFLLANTGFTFKTDSLLKAKPYYHKEIYIEKKQTRRKSRKLKNTNKKKHNENN